MDIVKHEKARFEKNSLIISDSITLPEWKELGQSLRQIEGCVQFWIGDWARFGDKQGFTGKYTDPKVYDELEDITGLQRKTLRNYKSISDNVESSRRRDDLTFGHHAEVAILSPDKQELFLTKASQEKLSIRDLRETIRKHEVQTTGEVALPDGKYEVIYADPPWEYGNSLPSYVTTPDNYYPSMSLAKICTMPIREITAPNAVLFLWVTSPLLREAFDVIDAWGFDYKTSFIWDKVKHNMGHYSSVRHEILLLCIKGSFPIKIKKLFDSVYSEERTEHSKKPEYYYEMIETLYPETSRIELFARNKRQGWENYGNQL